MRKTDFILMVSVLSVSLLTGCSKNSTNNKSSSTTENNNISVVIDTQKAKKQINHYQVQKMS